MRYEFQSRQINNQFTPNIIEIPDNAKYITITDSCGDVFVNWLIPME